ncbi:hypothetical protein BGZ89_006776, partial [Linnemannia elongata]
MVKAFNLTIINSAPTEQLIMIVLNPNLMTQQPESIYKKCFPVIWQVHDFAPSSEHGCLLLKFDSIVNVVLQDKTKDDEIYAKARLPVRGKEKFNIAKLDMGDYGLIGVNDGHGPIGAYIYNPFQTSFDVGLADDQGKSYLTMELPAKESLTFSFEVEFAVVPLTQVFKVQSKLKDGVTQRPWFSFKLADLKMEDISFHFDGNKITDQ